MTKVHHDFLSSTLLLHKRKQQAIPILTKGLQLKRIATNNPAHLKDTVEQKQFGPQAWGLRMSC